MGRWTKAERHFIHIARSEYGLDWTQIATMFPFAFPRGSSRYESPTPDELETEYPSQNSTYLAEMWGRHIVRTTYTTEQENDRATARRAIQTAAQRAGIMLQQPAQGVAGHRGGLGRSAGQTAYPVINSFAPRHVSTAVPQPPTNSMAGVTSSATGLPMLPLQPIASYHSSNLPRYTQQISAPNLPPSYPNPLLGSTQSFRTQTYHPNPLQGRPGPGMSTRYPEDPRPDTQLAQAAPMATRHHYLAPQTQSIPQQQDSNHQSHRSQYGRGQVDENPGEDGFGQRGELGSRHQAQPGSER